MKLPTTPSSLRLLTPLLITVMAGSDIQATVNIDSIAATIASASSEVQTTRLGALAETEELKSENVLSDPTVDFEHLWGQGYLGNKMTVGISQEFQLPMVYHSRRNLAGALSEEAEVGSIAAFFEMKLRAKRSLIERSYADEICRLRDSVATVAAERSAIMADLLTKGETTKLDLYKARVAAIDCRRDAESAIRDRMRIDSELASINGGRPVDTRTLAPIYISGSPEPLENYMKDFETENPEFALIEAHRNTILRRKDLLRAERWPSLSLGYIYNHELGETYQGLSFSVTLPVYSRSSKKKAAKLAAEQIEVADKYTGNNMATEFRQLHADAMSMWNELTLMRELFDDNDPEGLSVITRMRDVGKISAPEYLEELIEILQTKVTRLEAERDYAMTIASLCRYR